MSEQNPPCATDRRESESDRDHEPIRVDAITGATDGKANRLPMPTAVLDALPDHTALLDQSGALLRLNRAWVTWLTQTHGPHAVPAVGCDFATFLDQSYPLAETGTTNRAMVGIRRVLENKSDDFELEFACTQAAWFQLQAYAIKGHLPGVVIRCRDVSIRKQFELERWQRACELAALARLGRKVSQKLAVDAVVRVTLKEVGRTVNPDMCVLFLQDGRDLKLIGCSPNDFEERDDVPAAHRVGECLCGLALSTRQAVFSLNIHTDHRCTWNECKQAGFTSFTAVPLIVEEEPIGVLGMAALAEHDFHVQADFIEALSNEVAVGLKNALLYEALQAHAEQLQRWYGAHRKASEEKKKLEGQLRQSQKMEAIGTLAGGIAHDFNNILSAIMGYCELSLDDVYPGSDLQLNLRQIQKAGQRAADLVGRILTFSREKEIRKRPLRIDSIINEALKLLRSSLPASIVISADICQKPPLVNADATQIHQILINLCTNAAQAIGREQGRLNVRLNQTFLDDELAQSYLDILPGPYLVLDVSDDGCGIVPEIRDKIFDPYFTTREKEEGTGLGLSVVHGIVKAHQGDIRVYSEVGQGTTFRVFLPALTLPTKDALVLEEAPPEGCERILLVDDEAELAEIGQRFLAHLGYEILSVNNSPEAICQQQSGGVGAF